MRTAIETYSGKLFDFTNPQPEMVCVEDIARALSQNCRFGCHTLRFYSVAEHALLVRRLVMDVAGPELALAALHHDSHEAYLGDIPTPLKRLLGPEYECLAWDVDDAISRAFGFDAPMLFHHDIIKAADEQALYIEAAALKRTRGIGAHWGHSRTVPPEVPTGAAVGHDPQWVEALFLQAHRNSMAALATWRLS